MPNDNNCACDTRESWLQKLICKMRPVFAQLDVEIPKNIRVAIGFTSGGKRGKSVGECWNKSASADDYYEIFIRPDFVYTNQDVTMTVASILAHELIHACFPHGEGHGKNFKRIALGIGLTGKMTSTIAGEYFIDWCTPILKEIGDIPHSKLSSINLSAKKEQKNRHLKCKCSHCGYQVRAARKWIDDIGLPICPAHGEMELEI